MNSFNYPDTTIGFDTDEYFSSFGSINVGNDDDDEINANPDIVIENVLLYDGSSGQPLESVDKDSKPFTVEIVYLDYGLIDVNEDLYEDNIQVYITSTAGMVPDRSTRGTISIMSRIDDIPRFRVTFKNVKYDGTSNTLSFRTQYLVDGTPVTGEGTAVVYQVDDEDEDEKLAPLTPHIIISEYSYGDEQITAGSEFTLNLSVRNTSADIPLENIVMTIIPQTIAETTSNTTATGGLTITSASNSYYMESLPVGGVISHSIDLRAEPNAAVGSHKVEIKFQFQYVDEVNEKRETADDEESIAIPVTQNDRFSVDPITEQPDVLMVGEDGYITVSFINRGKSPTYNISGTVQGEGIATAGQSQHHGNLAAGEAASLDFEIVCYEPGVVNGEIVIQYEDENTNQNEITLPFLVTVEEPFVPDYGGDDMDWEEPEPEPGPGAASIVLWAVGGLLIAVPITLYLFKRVKAKGIEGLDEDF